GPREAMTNNIRYEIILYWSQEDQAFIAEVPELPGCAADGATYQEAVANAEVVIREWIETAKELSRPIPEPRGRLKYARAAAEPQPASPRRHPPVDAQGLARHERRLIAGEIKHRVGHVLGHAPALHRDQDEILVLLRRRHLLVPLHRDPPRRHRV